jgi:hypothetical protein
MHIDAKISNAGARGLLYHEPPLAVAAGRGNESSDARNYGYKISYARVDTMIHEQTLIRYLQCYDACVLSCAGSILIGHVQSHFIIFCALWLSRRNR